MTPAIKLAKKNKTEFQIHQYEHDTANNNFGHEAAEILGLDPHRVFKTLLFAFHLIRCRLIIMYFKLIHTIF